MHLFQYVPYGFWNSVIMDLAPRYNIFGTEWNIFVQLLQPGASALLKLDYLLLFKFPVRTEFKNQLWSKTDNKGTNQSDAASYSVKSLAAPPPPNYFLYGSTKVPVTTILAITVGSLIKSCCNAKLL